MLIINIVLATLLSGTQLPPRVIRLSTELVSVKENEKSEMKFLPRPTIHNSKLGLHFHS